MQDFKGFEFKLGEKSLDMEVNNANELAKISLNLDNFLEKFLNERWSNYLM